MLLRSITASAGAGRDFQRQPARRLFPDLVQKRQRQRKKPPNSTSFVAFTAITMFSG